MDKKSQSSSKEQDRQGGKILKQNVDLAPRDALAQSVKRAREVYQRDDVYGPEIRDSLKQVIEKTKIYNLNYLLKMEIRDERFKAII